MKINPSTLKRIKKKKKKKRKKAIPTSKLQIVQNVKASNRVVVVVVEVEVEVEIEIDVSVDEGEKQSESETKLNVLRLNRRRTLRARLKPSAVKRLDLPEGEEGE